MKKSHSCEFVESNQMLDVVIKRHPLEFYCRRCGGRLLISQIHPEILERYKK